MHCADAFQDSICVDDKAPLSIAVLLIPHGQGISMMALMTPVSGRVKPSN
jgi:hypothetical protein